MDGVAVVGWMAAALSTASFAPQAWRIIRTRDTEAISRSMYSLTVMAFALWACFGWMKQELALIVPNTICLVLSSFILLMKILPKKSKDAVANAVDPTK